MIRSILYATDLGLYASYVLQHGLTLARSFNASLHVIHAVEPLGLFAESVLQTYLDDDTLERMRQDGLGSVMASIERQVLEGFREELGEPALEAQLIESVLVKQGDPPQVILEQARRLGVDLLLIGSHSHGSGCGIPLGRTAMRLIQLSEVPVYLVPMLPNRIRSRF